MLIQLQRFLKNESGAAAIEYGLLSSGIAVAIIPSVKNVGHSSSTSSPFCRTPSKY